MDDKTDGIQTGTQTAIDYLIASKRCETQDLERFLALGDLVAAIRNLVHNLQRERGASNLFLASTGQRFHRERQQLCCATDTAITDFHQHLNLAAASIYLIPGGMRLFNRIAGVLHRLESLPILRAHTDQGDVGTPEATQQYNQMVQGLLAIVFDTADAAVDPTVSASLVAMFNFMQGKELAGQERAAGASGFASGQLDESRIEHIQHLVAGQQRCFEVFEDLADSALVKRWRQMQRGEPLAAIERLRKQMPAACRMAGKSPELASHWFMLTTQRIDAMKELEEALAAHLRALCEQRLQEAREGLQHHQMLLETLSEDVSPLALSSALSPIVGNPSIIEGGGRSVMELLQFQAQRLQEMSEELNAARGALEERKLIERAKRLLMKHRGFSEEQAYRLLQQTAMNQSRRLADIARSVIEMASVWN